MKKHDTVPNGFMRRREAARFLCISERHLATLVKRKVVPVVKLGHRCCLFDPDRIKDVLNKQESV